MDKGKHRPYLIIISLILLGLFYLRFESFFPNDQGYIGHDYSYFLPEILDGVYWQHVNGWDEVAWFTPSFGGGVPKFPNPQSLYYSVPQFLSFAVNPLLSIKIAVFLFGALGFIGFYLLLRRVFDLAPYPALLGSTMFLFNGFYLARMIVGHLSYHSFMLLPFLALMVLRFTKHRRDYFSDVVWGACIIAYMVYSGNIHLIPISLACVILLILIGALIRPSTSHLTYPAIKFMAMLSLATFIAAARLYASYCFLSLFPRDFYALPGYQSLTGTINLCFKALFLNAPQPYAGDLISTRYNFGLHEYEYGITLVPFVLLSTALILLRKKLLRLTQKQVWIFVLLSLLLLAPVLLNYYTPIWNQVLKHIPFLKSSSTLIRWIALYVPVFITLSSLGLQHLPWNPTTKKVIACLGIVGTIIIGEINLDRARYHEESYDPQPLLQNYEQLTSDRFSPQITGIDSVSAKNGQTLTKNDLLIAGLSQFRPYAAIFGYRLETFPVKSLHPGSIFLEDTTGHLNLKNPVSYVFPTENHLAPGDHFKVDQKHNALKLASYQPFTFEIPIAQKVANFITLATLFLLVIHWLITITLFALKVRNHLT